MQVTMIDDTTMLHNALRKKVGLAPSEVNNQGLWVLGSLIIQRPSSSFHI